MAPKGGSRIPADAHIWRLARKQHDVVALTQLYSAGLSRRVIRTRVSRGLLHRIHRGVYAVGRPELTFRGRCMAAALYAGNGAAVSHITAGALHGICAIRPGAIHVSCSRSIRRTDGIAIHRRRSFPNEAWGHIDPIPVTNLEQTLVDIAASEVETTVRRGIEEADRQKLLEVRPLSEACRRRRGQRGIPLLERLIDELTEPELTRSEFEDGLRDLCREHGLPMPKMNQTICGHEVDAHWPGTWLILECDSWKYHRHRGAFERDRADDADLMRTGYRVLHVTWRRMTDRPEQVAEDIRALLELCARD